MSLLTVAQSRPPRVEDAADLRAWTDWMGRSGARVTVIDSSGRVLADSQHDPETMENHSNRREIQQALVAGAGQSVRHSATIDRDLVYRAVRYAQPGASPVVIRMALPLAQVEESVSELRRRIYVASLVVLLLGGMIVAGLFPHVRRAHRAAEVFFTSRRPGRFSSFAGRRPARRTRRLADSLNETAAWMDRTIRSLSGERNRSSAILRSMVEGVAVIDAQERLVFCNRAFSEIRNLDRRCHRRAPGDRSGPQFRICWG